MGVTAVVLGASGYSGGELLRLLGGHPAIAVVAVGAHSRAGEPLGDVLPHLVGDAARLLPIDEAAAVDADVCFSCLPGGELAPRVGSVAARVVVDIADDHRAEDGWVYGLTEFARDRLVGATRIANPGCYPTATLLSALPFVRAGAVEPPIVVDAMSGLSGAGRRAEDRLLHATVEGNVTGYGPTPHRHVAEIERALEAFGGLATQISFTPHLVPMARGLVATVRARMRSELSDADALKILQDAYAGEPFVRVVDGWPSSKAVAGSNGAIVAARCDHRAGWLVMSAAIDNLGKGAAGQALQNANLALGLEESAGLTAQGVWP